MNTSLLDRYFELVHQEGLWTAPAHLKANIQYLFGDLVLAGRTVLEIGGGNGLFSLYAACAGAARVVCLEPEAAGSTAGVRRQFEQIVSALQVANVVLSPATFQQFEPGQDRFDVILLRNSINHLDEEACARLHRHRPAQEVYLALFRKMHDMAAPGAALIIADCSRYNVFAMLGMKNPLIPAIEWHKHQCPALWARLAGEVGWRDPKVRWKAINKLGAPGRLLLTNKWAAFFLMSHFCLSVRRA